MFDELWKGQSGLDVAIVFETTQSYSEAQSQALTKAIFFAKRSRGTGFENIQYAIAQVQKRFDLNADFLPTWRKRLGREVNVTVAFTSRTHGNEVLSFHRFYSFAWLSSASSDMQDRTEFSSSELSLSRFGMGGRTLQDMCRPDPQNVQPMRQCLHASYHLQCHAFRDIPRNYSSNSSKDLQDLDRGMDTPEITFDNMEQWLRARDAFECLREVRKQDYAWAIAPRHPERHRYGVWFKCLLNRDDISPALSENEIGVELDADGNLFMRGVSLPSCGDFCKGIHASSMYYVKSTLETGLYAGSVMQRHVKGIYCFNMNNPKLAVKSMGYAMYSELFDDNIFWAPYYELQIQRSLAGAENIGKITVGDQWVCKEELVPGFGPMFHLTAVWFHALPIEDLGRQGCNWVSLDTFRKEYELA